MYFDMMNESLKNLGVTFTMDQYEKFILYKNLLKEWNNKINLTTITDDNEIITKHFIDSLQSLKFEPLTHAKKIIDVGTGAGFPGIPLKIINDDFQLTLLDSLNKRVNFLKEVGESLELSDINYIHSRAEDGGNNPDLREKFDVSLSRAVANLTLLSEFCLPYVKVGGYFIALKGPSVDEEIIEAEFAINLFGGKFIEKIEVLVEGTDLKHNLIIIEKVKKTPKSYPRPSSAIKKPLK